MLIGGDVCIWFQRLACCRKNTAGRQARATSAGAGEKSSGHIVLLLRDKSSACMGKSRGSAGGEPSSRWDDISLTAQLCSLVGEKSRAQLFQDHSRRLMRQKPVWQACIALQFTKNIVRFVLVGPHDTPRGEARQRLVTSFLEVGNPAGKGK